MITINNVNYYTPREIAENKLIVNRKGKGDYGHVLRLIKSGRLEAKVFNSESKIPYYMVAEEEINRFLSSF